MPLTYHAKRGLGGAEARALTPELLRAAFGIPFELVATTRGPVPLALTPPG